MARPSKTGFRMVVLGCSLLDIVWPCAGRALLHRAPAGRWGMIWWMGFQIVLAMWTVSMMVNALQALFIYAVVWAVVQFQLQTRNLESLLRGPCEQEIAQFERRFSGRKLSILIILLVYVVTPAVFVTRAEKRLTVLTVTDFGTFPNILPGETLLVLKPGTRKARLGELVVWNSEHGTAVGRIVGTPGMRIAIRDGGVIVNGTPAPATPADGIEFPEFRLVEAELDEARDLEVFSEFYGDLKTPSQIFMRHNASVDGSEVEVPADSYFILSDNRSTVHSVDSRHVGPVPAANIAGQPMFVTWSAGGRAFERLDRIGSFPR